MTKGFAVSVLTAAFVACTAGAATAAPVTSIDSYDAGTYSRTGINAYHTTTNTSIVVGKRRDGTTITYFNGFSLFDLTGIVGNTVTAATLTFFGGNGAYDSTDVKEALDLWDVTSDLDGVVKTQEPATGALGYYIDLGSGVNYGSTVVQSKDIAPMPTVKVKLNAAAIDAINAVLGSADARFGVGTSLSTLDDGRQGFERLWAGSQIAPPASLSLTLAVPEVPVPAALPLLLGGLGALHLLRRRRNA